MKMMIGRSACCQLARLTKVVRWKKPFAYHDQRKLIVANLSRNGSTVINLRLIGKLRTRFFLVQPVHDYDWYYLQFPITPTLGNGLDRRLPVRRIPVSDPCYQRSYFLTH